MLAAKYALLAWVGGSTYVTVEVFFRARSHWTMFLVAAVVFIAVGLLNELFSWETILLVQILIGVAFATLVELLAGQWLEEYNTKMEIADQQIQLATKGGNVW